MVTTAFALIVAWGLMVILIPSSEDSRVRFVCNSIGLALLIFGVIGLVG